ncbi:tryptase beta-2, partial [Trichonephila clavata]
IEELNASKILKVEIEAIVPEISDCQCNKELVDEMEELKTYSLSLCYFSDLKANISICQGPGIPEECFVKPENSYIKLLEKEKLGKEVRIKRFIPHPEFINKPEQVTSDVALLELAETLQCGEMTSPICIANNEELYKKNQKIFVAGWGQHELKRKSITEKLREGLMMEVLSEECMKPGYSKDIANQLYCAAGTNQTACQGDSGSSAFINSEETFYSLGIVSYRGSETCDPKLPVTFAKTLYFLEWIKEHVKDLPEPE